MINFMKIRARLEEVKKMVANGYNICEIYAKNLEKLHNCSIEDDEEYETLTEIDCYLRDKIIEVYMEQNGYRRNRECNYERV